MFSDLSLNKKNSVIFGAIIAFVLVLAVSTTAAFKRIDSDVQKYSEYAQDYKIAAEITKNTLRLRLKMKDFLISNSREDLDKFNEYLTDLNATLMLADQEINKPERKVLVNEVKALRDQYVSLFGEVQNIILERNETIANDYQTTAIKIRQNLTEIIDTAYADGDPEAAYLGGQTSQALLLGRIYFTRYLRTNADSDLERVNLEFGKKFDDAEVKLIAAIQNPRRIELVNEAYSLSRELLVIVDKIAGLIQRRNELVLNNLDVIGPRIVTLAQEISDSVDIDRTALGEQTKQDISNSIVLTAILAVLVLAVAIGATWLAKILVVDPMLNASKVAGSIANGKLDSNIQITSKDETGQLLSAMHTMQSNLNQLIEKDISQLVTSANNGSLTDRIDLNNKKGAYKNLCQGVNQLVEISDTIVTDSARVLSALSNGDLSQTIDRDYKGAFAQLKNNANDTTTMLKAVIESDVQKLVDQAKAGNLSGRVTTSGRSGFYLSLCDGVNQLLETSDDVLSKTSSLLSAMAQGDMTQQINGEYSGAFKQLQQDGNATNAKLSQVIERDIQNLVSAAKSGNLSDRISTEGKTGLFLTLSDGINELVDVSENIISDVARIMAGLASGRLDEKITRNYQGIFKTLKDDANQTTEKLAHAIENEIQELIDQAKAGKLGGQIPEENKTGFYFSLATAINDLLRTNNQLVQETGAIFEGLAKGDLNQSMTGEYDGDFARLQENAHTTIARLKEVIEGDIQSIVDAAKSGDLNERINLEGKEGFFATLSTSINDLVNVNESIINDTNLVAKCLAQGDLTQRIDSDYKGTFASLADNINESSDNTSNAIVNIHRAAEQVSTASQEISRGNNDLKHRTEIQASSLEETTATMRELMDQVNATATRAANSASLAEQAKSSALQGGGTVDEAVAAMEQINQSSRKISDIIGVIDEIAFQTNLLALNAAVEAARAGESGRGFSVVAAEVRALAQRSAQAAKEIKDLIVESGNKVTDGTKLVNTAGEKLKQIVNAVAEVTEAVDVIQKDAQDQQSSISQVFDAIDNLNENTQQNAALVEESTSAATIMSQQAEQMFVLVNGFKTA